MKNREHKPFRHELKYLINTKECDVLVRRLSAIMQKDSNGSLSGYTIRSLYFDDLYKSSYGDKLAGTFARKKYRIRIYNYSDSVIKLECKEKLGEFIYKESALISREETESILLGDYSFLLKRPERVCRNFYIECMSQILRPAIIVDYSRIAFVYGYGDVRITFDSNLKSSWQGFDLFDEKLPAYEVFQRDNLVMEIKYTQMFPEIIRSIVALKTGQRVAASKYTMCAEIKEKIITVV